MKMLFASVLAAVLGGISIHAQDTNAPAAAAAPAAPPVRIGTDTADKHIDESAIVTGKVAQVTFRPKVVFINLDKAFPDAPFTAVIMAKDTNGFGDLKALEGKDVSVSGKIKAFHDKPEIVIDNTNQLQVVETK
jgi:DNA/RNA endonuclease YhcR with UshA esterase domain